jgi:hypothetical protein
MKLNKSVGADLCAVTVGLFIGASLNEVYSAILAIAFGIVGVIILFIGEDGENNRDRTNK